MPRGSRGAVGAEEARVAGEKSGLRARSGPPISPKLAAAVRPWIDVDEVGMEGLETFLLSILPLAAKPEPAPRPGVGATEERVAQLARALAECAGDRARVHFQASLYFRANQLLARRVMSLEAILRTRSRAQGTPPPPDDPQADAVADRYLPRRDAP